MSFNIASLPNLVIPNGGQNSNVVTLVDDAYGISVNSPSALTGTVTFEVENTSTGTNFVTQQSGGADVTISASKGLIVTPCPFRQFRMHSNAAEGADRTFTANKVVPV